MTRGHKGRRNLGGTLTTRQRAHDRYLADYLDMDRPARANAQEFRFTVPPGTPVDENTAKALIAIETTLSLERIKILGVKQI